MKTFSRTLQWVLGAIGASIALVGAGSVGSSQVSSGSTLWPLPGLVLLDWALLGLFGFVGLISEGRSENSVSVVSTWFVVGALIPLIVLGVFSIGPFVLLSWLAFFVAALLASGRSGGSRASYLKALLAGAVGNLALLYLFITFGRPLF